VPRGEVVKSRAARALRRAQALARSAWTECCLNSSAASASSSTCGGRGSLAKTWATSAQLASHDVRCGCLPRARCRRGLQPLQALRLQAASCSAANHNHSVSSGCMLALFAAQACSCLLAKTIVGVAQLGRCCCHANVAGARSGITPLLHQTRLRPPLAPCTAASVARQRLQNLLKCDFCWPALHVISLAVISYHWPSSDSCDDMPYILTALLTHVVWISSGVDQF
jgi:hypothetical protein